MKAFISWFLCSLAFLPTDFTQVNPSINQAMIGQVLDLLQLNASDTVLDLFCGLGNFTLPMAQRAERVIGVEGEVSLVQRAWANAQRNGIDNAFFALADLGEDPAGQSWMQGAYSKILLDPPRSGAQEIVPQLGKLGAERILYVSCHPVSLARDAGVLTHELGYRLLSAGVMDMFPHTAHVESVALFVKDLG